MTLDPDRLRALIAAPIGAVAAIRFAPLINLDHCLAFLSVSMSISNQIDSHLSSRKWVQNGQLLSQFGNVNVKNYPQVIHNRRFSTCLSSGKKPLLPTVFQGVQVYGYSPSGRASNEHPAASAFW